MKNILVLFLFCTASIFAQKNLKGKAIYQSKTNIQMNFEGRDIPEDRKKMIMDRMKSMSERSYTLNFNTTESIYKENERLETVGSNSRGRFGAMMSSFSPGLQYKNTQTEELLESKEFFGKKFLIEENIQKPNWELGSETKQIGQYTCFKATLVKKVSATNFGSFRPRGNNNQNSETPSEKEITVTAWYTPQIPISNGPGDYWGLPGLILEINQDQTTILCSEIVLNSSDDFEIIAPKKGKKVSREEYNKIVAEKTKEMRERFQRGRGNGGGRGRF